MKKHIILVDDEYFNGNIKVFTKSKCCTVLRTIIEDDLFNNDECWQELYLKKKDASKKLYDYEYEKRWKIKK